MPPWDFTIKPPTTSPIDALNAGSEFMGGLLDARALGLQRAQVLEANKAQESRAAWEFQQKQMLVAQAQAQAQQQALAAKAAAEQAAAARAKWQTFGVDTPVAEYEALIRENPQALSLPGFSEMFKAQSDGAKQQFIVDISEPIAFLKSGQKQLAVDALSKQQVAYENAGDMKSAAARAKLAEIIEKDPDAGFRQAFALFASGATKEQMDSIGRVDEDAVKLRKAQADADKAAADAQIAKEESLRAADTIAARIGLTKAQTAQAFSTAKNLGDRLAFDKQNAQELVMLEYAKLDAKAKENMDKGPDFNPKETEILDKYTTSASEAAVTAAQAKRLASTYRSKEMQEASTGKTGAASEMYKSFFGSKDKVSQARALFDEIKNKKVLASLPPGAASDKDVNMMSMPFPSATDDPTFVAEFLDTLARVSAMDATLQGGKVEWMSSNRAMSAMRQPTVIDGIPVQPGESYQDWMDKVIARDLPPPSAAVDDVAKVKTFRALPPR